MYARHAIPFYGSLISYVTRQADSGGGGGGAPPPPEQLSVCTYIAALIVLEGPSVQLNANRPSSDP
jgi:hypothetical protein